MKEIKSKPFISNDIKPLSNPFSIFIVNNKITLTELQISITTKIPDTRCCFITESKRDVMLYHPYDEFLNESKKAIICTVNKHKDYLLEEAEFPIDVDIYISDLNDLLYKYIESLQIR